MAVRFGDYRVGCIKVERDGAAFAAGCEAARSDIAAGRLVYRWRGHAGHWGHWLVTRLAERFGVTVDDGFGTCFVTDSALSFNEGYNSVLIAEVDRRYGSGAFQTLVEESRRQSEESLWDARQAWLGPTPCPPKNRAAFERN